MGAERVLYLVLYFKTYSLFQGPGIEFENAAAFACGSVQDLDGHQLITLSRHWHLK